VPGQTTTVDPADAAAIAAARSVNDVMPSTVTSPSSDVRSQSVTRSSPQMSSAPG